MDASELLKEFDYLQSNDTDIQTQVTDTFHTMLEQLASDKKVPAVLSIGFFKTTFHKFLISSFENILL